MAKIIKVCLESIPKEIQVNDKKSDFTVLTDVEFHPLDIKIEMEYILHLFVYDINGIIDIPIIVNNWDETSVKGVSLEHLDDLLGTERIIIKAQAAPLQVACEMSLHLGKLSPSSSAFKRELGVFATIIPAIGRASKWSAPFESLIVY